MLSIILIVAGYGMAALSIWRYRATQQKRLKVGGILLAIVATALVIATIAGPVNIVA